MISIRELETELRSIRMRCRDAIDDSTGMVDVMMIAEQATRLKKWTADFSNSYIQESKRKPQIQSKIVKEGHKIAEQAWFCCEVLWNVEIDAGSASPAGVRWEGVHMESGVVLDLVKSEMITEIGNLLNAYQKYRKEILKQ